MIGSYLVGHSLRMCSNEKGREAEFDPDQLLVTKRLWDLDYRVFRAGFEDVKKEVPILFAS